MRWIELIIDGGHSDGKPILINLETVTDILPINEADKPGTYISIIDRKSAVRVKEKYDDIVARLFTVEEI